MPDGSNSSDESMAPAQITTSALADNLLGLAPLAVLDTAAMSPLEQEPRRLGITIRDADDRRHLQVQDVLSEMASSKPSSLLPGLPNRQRMPSAFSCSRRLLVAGR